MGVDTIKFSKPAFARWQVVTRAEGKYVVYRPDGQIHEICASKVQADAIVARKQKAMDLALKRMNRPCMCCQKPFPSAGIHNRLCDGCRRQNGELIPYGVAPRSGRPK